MAFPINVPVNQRPALRELAVIDDDVYNAIRESLIGAAASAEPSSLIEHTSRAVSGKTALGGQIIGTVVGLRSFVDRSSVAVAEIAESVAADGLTKNYIPQDKKEIVKKRLAELLESDAVTVSAKAFALIMTDPTPFNDVRIVSDVRPIFFGTEAELDFKASVIVHHLRFEIAGSDDQFCTLSSADLLKLKRVVDRAIEKDKKLRNALRGGPLTPLAQQP